MYLVLLHLGKISRSENKVGTTFYASGCAELIFIFDGLQLKIVIKNIYEMKWEFNWTYEHLYFANFEMETYFEIQCDVHSSLMSASKLLKYVELTFGIRLEIDCMNVFLRFEILCRMCVRLREDAFPRQRRDSLAAECRSSNTTSPVTNSRLPFSRNESIMQVVKCCQIKNKTTLNTVTQAKAENPHLYEKENRNF